MIIIIIIVIIIIIIIIIIVMIIIILIIIIILSTNYKNAKKDNTSQGFEKMYFGNMNYCSVQFPFRSLEVTAF